MLARRCLLTLPGVAAAALALLAPATVAQQPGKGPPPGPPINAALARLDVTIAGLDGPGFGLAYAEPCGMLAAACEEDTIQLWGKDAVLNIRSGSGSANVFRGHAGAVTDVAWNGGPVLASAGVDLKLVLWSAADGTALHTLPTGRLVRALAMSPDGKLVAAAGDDPAVQLWEAGTGKAGSKLQGHTDWVLCVAFSPDGKQLASGGYDGVVRVWDAAAGTKVRDVKAEVKADPKAPPPDPDIIWSVAFSPDGKQLAVGNAEGKIDLFGVGDGKLIRSMPGHGSAVTALQFHPREPLLLSASKDRTLRLWNPANGQAVKVLEGHDAWVTDAAFVADGTRIASVGADRTVRVWDLTATK
jgi:WD40 repeat protein